MVEGDADGVEADGEWIYGDSGVLMGISLAFLNIKLSLRVVGAGGGSMLVLEEKLPPQSCQRM